MISFKEFLKEAAKKSPDIIDQYGKILFGTGRKLPEPDTDEEHQQWKDLFSYFDFDGKSNANTFKELLKAKKYFTILKGDTHPILYRGISFPSLRSIQDSYITKQILAKTNMKNLEKHFIRKEIEQGASIFISKKQYIYKPQRIVESWTIDQSVAMNFSNNSPSIKGEGYLISSKIPQTQRLFTASMTEKLKKIYLKLPSEHEVIRVSNKPIKITVEMSENVAYNIGLY